MFIAKQELIIDGKPIAAGEEVTAPTSRMKELGLVQKVKVEAKVETITEVVKPKGKKSKAKKLKTPIKEEELLVEISEPIQVETEEVQEETETKGFFGKFKK